MDTLTLTTPSTITPMNQKISYALEAKISNKERITVKEMASTFGFKVPAMRQKLITIYGSRITFKRGRTGGIELS